MTVTYGIAELKARPLCGAGETHTDERHLPPRMSGPGALISVSIKHWCAKRPGVVQAFIEIRGRDHTSAIDAWNTRP